MTPTRDERLDELLVDWELARRAGRSVEPSDLCDDPQLAEDFERACRKLLATEWVVDETKADALGDDWTSDGPSDASARSSSRIDVTTDELLDRATELDLISEEVSAGFDRSQPPRQAAENLVRDGRLTEYQADVLLHGRVDSPLVLDRYIILDTLGAGGMGLVFKARHRTMDRVVALKLLPRHAFDSEEKRNRFQREVHAVAQLTHPNIVAAYDASESQGVFFLVMEQIEGRDLRELVRQRGRLTIEEALAITADAAAGLAEAHRVGITHRDIKPSNIMLGSGGEVKVLDLGLSRFKHLANVTGDAEITRDGIAMGTVDYMSPEQALDSRDADEQSDIYSLGCTLYFLLTGKPPFRRDTAVKTIVAHREEALPDLPPEFAGMRVERILQRMLAKRSADRYASMWDVRSDLLAAISDFRPSSPGGAAPKQQADTRGTSRVLFRLLIATSFVALIGVVGIAALSWIAFSSAAPAPTTPSETEIAEWVLKLDGVLTVETDFDQFIVEHRDDLPRRPFDVVRVELFDVPKELSLEPLLHLPDLETLAIYGGPAVVDQMQTLGKLQQLHTLDLVSCQISGEALAHLNGLTRLMNLDLTDNPLSAKDLATLSRLPNLETLYLNETNVGDEVVPVLATFPSLTGIHADSCRLTDRGMRELCSAKRKLESLDVANTRVSDDSLDAIAGLTELRELVLDFCKITDEGLKHLQGRRNITDLYLEHTEIGDDGLATIAGMDGLRYLDIASTHVSAQGIRHLSSSKALRQLRLSGLTMDEPMLQAIAELRRLRRLDVSETNLNDEGLLSIARLEHLKNLDVSGTKITSRGLDAFQELAPDCNVFVDKGLE